MEIMSSEKSNEIEELLYRTFNVNRRKTIENGDCVFCDHKIEENEFRDEISKKEYSISGMCQKCQDDFFGVTDQ